MSVHITLPMQATGKARPRERGRLPTAYRRWKQEARVRLVGLIRASGWVKATDSHRQPVLVRVVAYRKRPAKPPQWMTKQERAAWRQGQAFLRLATPDADNLEGAVWDALNDTGLVWEDDSQAISVGCWEWYSAPGEGSRIEITLALGHVTREPLPPL